MIGDPWLLLMLLIGCHFIADYGLQTEYMAINKSRNSNNPEWPMILGAHSMIHSVPVALLTGYWWLGLAEAIAHFFIDDIKSRGKTSHIQDQMLHISCKLVWWTIALALVD